MNKKQTRNQRLLIVIGLISVAVYGVTLFFPTNQTITYTKEMLEATQIMEQASEKIQQHSINAGLQIDTFLDLNQTGLIGPEDGDLTTSLGHLEAKRTTTNPNMASLLVHIFREAGVEKGDTVAVGCSASFPALLVSTLSACKAAGVEPVVMISMGASSFGATDSRFHLLNIYEILFEMGMVKTLPVTISLGGEGDLGLEFSDTIRKKLIQDVHSSGVQLINEPNFQTNVKQRMEIYKKQKSACFVNIGGSEANLGKSPLALKVRPGLNTKMQIPEKNQRGVLFEMADQEIPIIQLLYIKGLSLQYGLPWDPTPLPKPGESRIVNPKENNKIPFLILTFLYFAGIGILAYFKNRKNLSRQITQQSP